MPRPRRICPGCSKNRLLASFMGSNRKVRRKCDQCRDKVRKPKTEPTTINPLSSRGVFTCEKCQNTLAANLRNAHYKECHKIKLYDIPGIKSPGAYFLED